MRTFAFFIDDRRCAEPRTITVETRDEGRARELAERMLAQSEHHLGVEVCDDGRRVFGIGSFGDRSWCEREEAPKPAAA